MEGVGIQPSLGAEVFLRNYTLQNAMKKHAAAAGGRMNQRPRRNQPMMKLN